MSEQVTEISRAYESLVKSVEQDARDDGDRAYGGVIRAKKGSLVEVIAKSLVGIAWDRLGGNASRLGFDHKKIKIPMKPDYVNRLKNEEVARFVSAHLSQYNYGLSTDVHVWIDGRFVLGIECKAYTENAMLKRILVDFTLLRQVFPSLKCALLQLESQLTGDYSRILNRVTYGSKPTHTLLSYFDVDLVIITLLEGERKVDQPIHKQEFFKRLPSESIDKALDSLEELLREFV